MAFQGDFHDYYVMWKHLGFLLVTKATDIANAITVACCLHSIIEGNAEVQVGVSRNKGVIFFSIEV